MDDEDRRELERLRQLMDMNVWVGSDDVLRCGFSNCRCIGSDGYLEIPSGQITLFDVAEAIMEHRVKWLMVAS